MHFVPKVMEYVKSRMSESSNTFKVSSEEELISVPTYNEFERELMSSQDLIVVGDNLDITKPLVSLAYIPGFALIKEVMTWMAWR